MKGIYVGLLLGTFCLVGQVPQGSPIYKGTVTDNYITRWEFQKIGKLVYDPYLVKKYFPTVPDKGLSFDPATVQSGDIVFARDPHSFFATIHPQISNPYILVVHGMSEDRLTNDLLPLLESDLLIAYFTIHPPETQHPKLFPLPAGVKQRKDIYARKDELSQTFVQYRAGTKKKHLLYCNFLNRTHECRPILKSLFKNKEYCYLRDRCRFDEFIKDVAESVFVLSPPGKGIDANRTWEALLLGSIPIVISSCLNPLYEDLPVLIVEDWSEITEEFLLQKHKEIIAKEYDLTKLYVEYWFAIIKKVQQDFLSQYLPM